MTIHVFVGPTLRVDQAREILPDAVFLPPVSQGDVLRSTARRPSSIGIIDGRFHDVPAVWHKEIMWALSRGVAVYGSASMGALRAAELAPFGMRGVGAIYHAFRGGELNDDDEVAVAHADAASGYQPTNEAMVSIRATLAYAVTEQVVSAATASVLERLAKQTYYVGRSYGQMLLDGQEAGLSVGELTALRAWLPAHRINQKALDAQEMLRVMADEAETPPAPVAFKFEHTSFFEQSRQTAGELSEAGTATDSATTGPVQVNMLEIMDELRLDPARYRSVWERAALRAVVDAASATPPDDIAKAAAVFRRSRGLTGTEETRAWLEHNDLSLDHFGTLVGIEQKVRTAIDEVGEMMPLAMMDMLRIDGDYGPFVRLILAKREFLADHGLDRPVVATDEQTTARQLDWYFTQIGQPVPDSLDTHWHPLGFADRRDFLRAVRREYHYRTLADFTEGGEI